MEFIVCFHFYILSLFLAGKLLSWCFRTECLYCDLAFLDLYSENNLWLFKWDRYGSQKKKKWDRYEIQVDVKEIGINRCFSSTISSSLFWSNWSLCSSVISIARSVLTKGSQCYGL